MTARWPKVRLAQVVTPVFRREAPLPGRDYRQIGVRLWGEGAYERETIDGGATKYQQLFRAEAGDLIVNKIWARNGSVAVVREDQAGTYGSGEFPMFEPDRTKIDPQWLHWLTKLKWFWAQCDEKAQGTSGKNRITPSRFLEIEIPLPPLEEQRRIVASLKSIAERADSLGCLRFDTIRDIDEMLMTVELSIWPDHDLHDAPALDDLTTFLARGRQSEQGSSDHYLIKTQHVQMDRYVPTALRLAPHVASRVQPEALVQDGDILIACSAAGCLGRVARYSGSGVFASTDTHVAIARANPKLVDPDYLYAYLRGAQGQHQLRSRERGDWQREKIGFRLTELNLRDLKAIPVPLPDRDVQHHIVERIRRLRHAVASLFALHAQIATDLDALLVKIRDEAFACTQSS